MAKRIEGFKLRDVMPVDVIFLFRIKKGEDILKVLQDMFPDYYCDFIRFPREVRNDLIRKFKNTDMSLAQFLDAINDTFNEIFLFWFKKKKWGGKWYEQKNFIAVFKVVKDGVSVILFQV